MGPHDQHGFFKIPGRKVYVGDVGYVGEKIKKGIKIFFDSVENDEVLKFYMYHR